MPKKTKQTNNEAFDTNAQKNEAKTGRWQAVATAALGLTAGMMLNNDKVVEVDARSSYLPPATCEVETNEPIIPLNDYSELEIPTVTAPEPTTTTTPKAVVETQPLPQPPTTTTTTINRKDIV